MKSVLKKAHKVCEKEDGKLKNLTMKDLIEIRNKYGEPNELGDPVEAIVFDHYCYKCDKCGKWSISEKEYWNTVSKNW